jgi:hypothetical protein
VASPLSARAKLEMRYQWEALVLDTGVQATLEWLRAQK